MFARGVRFTAFSSFLTTFAQSTLNRPHNIKQRKNGPKKQQMVQPDATVLLICHFGLCTAHAKNNFLSIKGEPQPLP